MTALDRYLRLEAVGMWRETPGTRPREVVVSFGRTTLLLTDLEDRPLGHWALAGVREAGRDADGATVYAMSAGETLTIGDRDMVAAIAAVRRRLPEPRRPRRRLPVGPIVAAAALAAAVAWGPRLIRAATVRLVPPEQASEIGDRMLIALIEAHGPPCSGREGELALARLAESLDPVNPPRLRVMDLGGRKPAALPGGTVVVDRGAVAAGDPGDIALQAAQALAADPVAALVADAGLRASLRYIFTGHFDDRSLARAAEAALARESLPATAEPPVPALAGPEREALRGICG